jgi:Arylsulfotransferase (ASST)
VRVRPVLLAAALLACPAPAEAFTTKPPLIPKFRRSVSDYVSRCRLGHSLHVKVGKHVKTHRLRAGQGVRVRTGGRTYHVRCIPRDFPKWRFERHGTPQAQYFLVTPTLGPHGSRVVALFNRDGVPVWWMQRGTKPHDAKLLPDGNLAWSTFTNGEYASHSVPYEEHALDGRLVRRIAAVGVPTDGHDMEVMPNGHYLVVSYVPRSGVDLSAYGGPKRATVIDNEIQEVTRSGRRVWRWNTRDHLSLSESEPFMKYIVHGPVRTADGWKAYDIVHLNSVEPDGDSLIFSTRQTDAVYKINRATGAVEWKLGGTTIPQSLSVTGDPDPSLVISGQHDARLLPDGTLTLHDNRTLLADSKPRALRFGIDEAAGTATVLESLTDPQAGYSICCGSARKLPGGDWVASWGSSGLVTELTPGGRRLYALRFGGHHGADSYRAFPVMPGRLSIGALRRGMDRMARKH